MEKIYLFVLCVFIVLLGTSCQSTQTRATEGAVIGGVLGAATGGIIGHQSHHGGEGAGIGAAVGVITGAVVGSQIPKPRSVVQTTSANQQAGITPAASPSQMSISQIIELTQQGVNENVIIDKIRLTNSRFTLATNDINYLKQQGVSQRVIDTMQGG